jgi:hypothetical protein
MPAAQIGLEQMFRNVSGKKAGRPTKRQAKPAAANLTSIEAMIEQLVQARVKTAIGRAIEALRKSTR